MELADVELIIFRQIILFALKTEIIEYKKGTSCEVPFLLNEKFNKNYFSAKYALISSSSKMFCVLKM